MEHNVVSLETAKKLKAAGFSQTDTAFWWFGKTDGSMEVNTRDDSAPFAGYAAPTAQEIADQLPEALEKAGEYGRFILDYQSGDAGVRTVPRPLANEVYAEGPTMADALAALWLKLEG